METDNKSLTLLILRIFCWITSFGVLMLSFIFLFFSLHPVLGNRHTIRQEIWPFTATCFSIVGFVMLIIYNKKSLSKFLLGFIIGVIIPLSIIPIKNHADTRRQMDSCMKDPQLYLCETLLSKSEREIIWEKNMKVNCDRLNRGDYYIYRCPDRGVNVPSKYQDKLDRDYNEKRELINSLNKSYAMINSCIRENSPLNKPSSQQFICDWAKKGFSYDDKLGKWPQFSDGWESSMSYSSDTKSYDFELKKYDMTITCDQKNCITNL